MSEIIKNENYIQEDEIDLKELFLTIRKHILKIFVFVTIVIFLSFVYVLKIPNMYKSEVLLSSQGESTSASGGQLSSLAALAGVNLGSKSAGLDPFLQMQTTLGSYEFNAKIIKKYDLYTKLNDDKNYVFAFGIDAVYEFFKTKNNEDIVDINEDIIFSTFNALQGIISLSSDKKTGLITLQAKHKDRFLAKELVDIYLKEIILYIKKSDAKELDNQIRFYQNELFQAKDIALKEQLSKSLSGLLQKRVFAKANEFYIVSKLRDSRVAYIKEKQGPKRALILVVSAVTSFILAIFLVFLIEFIRNEKK